MVNEQIVSYIQSEFAQGVARESIKQALLVKGWPPQDVEDALYAVENPGGVTPPQVLPQASGRKHLFLILSSFLLVIGGAVGLYFYTFFH